MSKNRGNPNWGKAMTVASGPSSFEQLVKQLGLSPDQYHDSVMLKEWVTKHKDSKYVPQDVLQLWGFSL